MADMSNEQAARVLTKEADGWGDERVLFETYKTALRMGAAALRGPQPDPITGLVPCGCGGKAVIHDHQNYGEPGMNYWVGCDNQKCDCTVGMYLDETGRFEKKEDAIKAWNKAHGYKGGAE